MGISRTWCQSGEFVLECEKHIKYISMQNNMANTRTNITFVV